MKQSLGPRPMIFPCPVMMVGTYDTDRRPNLMTAAWGGILCSSPPCLGIALRKATYTYGNLMTRKAFTVNLPSENQVALADYAGIHSGRSQDKFERLKLTPIQSELVDAPYVEEIGFVAECMVIQTVEIGLHTLFVGQVMDIKADPEILSAEGTPDLSLLRPVAYAPGNQSYHGLGAALGRAFEMGKSLGG